MGIEHKIIYLCRISGNCAYHFPVDAITHRGCGIAQFHFILLWMECWNPVMVVLNEIFSEQARSKIEALKQAVYQRLGTTSGEPLNFHITLSKQDEIFNIAI